MHKSKKTILWIAKESFTSLVDGCIQYFEGYNHSVVFVHPTEVLCQDPTYNNFVERHPEVKIYSYTNILESFLSRKKGHNSDLLFFLDKYQDEIGIDEIKMSSQLFTTPYHYRKYFRDLKEEEILHWIAEVFKYSEEIIINSDCDYILDFDNSELSRTILWLIGKKRSIPYITLEHSRYDGYIVPNFSLNRKNDQFFKKKYETIEPTLEVLKEVEDYRLRIGLANPDYRYNNTLKKTNLSFLVHLKRLFQYLRGVLKKHIKIRSLPKPYRNLFFIANPWKSYLHFIQGFIRERYLFSSFNKQFIKILPHHKYIYFPLHLIPESSTLIKAPFYPNEKQIIESVSKVLPLGYSLIIKEHGAMIGERPLSFYRDLNRLSNVKCARLDCFTDPKEWINNSQGVITITGTSAFEAVMLGKGAVVLGAVPFEDIDGVFKSGLDDLKENIHKMLNFSQDNVKSCGKYLSVLKCYGEKIGFTQIHSECYSNLLRNIPQDVNNKNTKLLASVFRKGMRIADNA